jgi:hypothetical protein
MARSQRRTTGVIGEGIVAGLVGAAVVALWYLAHDFAHGMPLRTPTLLGGILFEGLMSVPETPQPSLVLAYSAVHLAAFALFGIGLAGLFALADREPIVLFGVFMLLCCLQVAFVVLLRVLAEWALEPIPWWTILVANLLATAGMLAVLLPRHRAAWRPWTGRRDPLDMPDPLTRRR